MRWGDMRRSENVEDRTAGGGGGGFGIGGLPLSGGALILVVIASLLFGVNPLELLGVMGGSGPAPEQRSAPDPRQGAAPGGGANQKLDQRGEFAARVLGDTETFWTQTFAAAGQRYTPPRLVLFRGGTRSACGSASAASGPFYCPGDREVYLDTSFFDQLRSRFGAPGDFASAYVIAHEVGHHVQNLLGTMQKFDAQASRLDARGRNALSVRLELQADCFAGVWGASANKRGLLEPGDVEEGIRAAQAVGDDTIMKRTQGVVVPDAFTHGSAEQRTRWFKTGYTSGDLRSCDTFAAP